MILLTQQKLFKASFRLDFIVDDEEYLPDLLANNASVEKLQKAYKKQLLYTKIIKILNHENRNN